MTKIHEKFIRGKVESIENFTEPLKGELTIVLSEIIKKRILKKKSTNRLK